MGDPTIVPIPGTHGYGVSPDGRVWSQRVRLKKDKLTGVWREMAMQHDHKGYLRVCLRIKGVSVTCKTHRIIHEVFIGPIPTGLQINHKNGIKDDNRAENLEAVTPFENMQHSWETGLRSLKDSYHRGTEHHNARLTPEQVVEIHSRYSAGGITQRQLSREYGISQCGIWFILHGKNWRHIHG